eukprot:TRINITY_DN13662_c0_g1_i1.p1 TRINITY_DN13662_c0_g1~~TRINITY_DN13662_c0_g1_i1.p1  ORF type:complete len:150 (-),score=13.95 TRINITY_DN13662_c0_g1_i1:32-481(-)
MKATVCIIIAALWICSSSAQLALPYSGVYVSVNFGAGFIVPAIPACQPVWNFASTQGVTFAFTGYCASSVTVNAFNQLLNVVMSCTYTGGCGGCYQSVTGTVQGTSVTLSQPLIVNLATGATPATLNYAMVNAAVVNICNLISGQLPVQ